MTLNEYNEACNKILKRYLPKSIQVSRDDWDKLIELFKEFTGHYPKELKYFDLDLEIEPDD